MIKSLDSEIWQRFRSGDEKAFSYIFDAYHHQLFEYGQRFTSDEDLVRDSIQDVFFELAQKKGKLSPTDNILFYLLKSLRQKVFYNLRKNKNVSCETIPALFEEFHLKYSTEVNPEEKELNMDRLAHAVNQLPARQKETIYLKFYKNLSNKEIAEMMQISYQSVGNNIQKAIYKLKTLIESGADSIIFFFQNCFR